MKKTTTDALEPLEDQDRRLHQCNTTELLWIAREQGLGHLKRGLPRETLVALITGELNLDPSRHLAGTAETRARLQKFIWDNIDRTRSQLPGCTGKCTEYTCTEGRHALCFAGNKDVVR